MDFAIFNSADELQFIRNDALSAIHTEEQFYLSATFPLDTNKMLERGMRIGFTDQQGIFQLFEIRMVTNTIPDDDQEIEAEHICLSELADEIIETMSISRKVASVALATILSGTQWSVGTTVVTSTHSQTARYAYVWDELVRFRNIFDIEFKPRVIFTGSEITGRYIDFVSDTPVNRGVRLEIDRNMEQAGVIYDDRGMFTALYGIGKQDDEDSSVYVNFEDVVWTVAGGDPVDKPAGQGWVEDPAATALYGRNGRKRMGKIEYSDQENAEDLLTNTWNYLQTVNSPGVTIDAVFTDLYQYGYENELVLLNDEVTCIIRPLNVLIALTVIAMERDLLNPEKSKPTIGTYRADIVEINRGSTAATESVDILTTVNGIIKGDGNGNLLAAGVKDVIVASALPATHSAGRVILIPAE